MTKSLREEIKQAKPFATAAQEAHLSVVRTAAVLSHAMTDALREFGVTPTQYNALRILRGAGKDGLCRHEIRDRLVAEVPDVTRLLDRMEGCGLIVRERDSEDRRLVSTKITGKGLELLRRLDKPVIEIHERLLGHMADRDLRRLTELLATARERA